MIDKELNFDAADRNRNRVVLGLSVAVSIALLVYLFLALNRGELMSVFADVDLRFLAAIAGFSLLANAIMAADRWRLILRSLGVRTPFRELVRIELGFAPFKIFLPLKFDEVLKSYYVSRCDDHGFARMTGSRLLDRFLLATAMAFVLGIGAALNGSVYAFALVPLVATAVLLGFSARLREAAARTARRSGGKSGSFTERLLSAFGEVRAPMWAYMFAYAVVLNAFFVLYFGWSLRAVGVEPDWRALLLYVPLIEIIAALPVAFSGFGSREVATVMLLKGMAAPEQLLAGCLLFELVDRLLFPLVGLFWTRYVFRRLSDARRQRATERAASDGRA